MEACNSCEHEVNDAPLMGCKLNLQTDYYGGKYFKLQTYTDRQLEMAYCIGFLNKENLSMDELAKELVLLKERFKLAKEFIKKHK